VATEDEHELTNQPELDQYFLNNSEKLEILINAAGIRPDDDVVEVGAGIGTVAKHVPACHSLTVVERDPALIPQLRRNVPHAQIIQGDALVLLPRLRCHVLLSSLPVRLTAPLAALLPALHFRTALMVTAPDAEFAALREYFTIDVVTALAADDFRPARSDWSVLVRLNRTAVTR
jgi:16S rRNA A1518/A1519 N6-dimethyltransferase RsmA/KsgA/DIM1 with predicted DNA glycosylase/AP lyase activity